MKIVDGNIVMTYYLNTRRLEMADKMKEVKTYNTTDYDKFKYVLSNRPVAEHHVKEIMAEIQRKDLTAENPVKVTRSYEIMEGQHTAEACKRLNIPVYYIYTKMTDSDIGKYNSVQKSWSYDNILNHYCVKGVEDYRILAGFRRRHPYPLSTIIILLSGRNTKKLMTEFRNGEFTITQRLDTVEELLSQIGEFKEYNDKIYRHRTFVLAYIDVLTHPDFDHTTFIHKLSLSPNRFVKCDSRKEYFRMIEDIYNKRNNNPIRLF
jgi:hypothetical protein